MLHRLLAHVFNQPGTAVENLDSEDSPANVMTSCTEPMDVGGNESTLISSKRKIKSKKDAEMMEEDCLSDGSSDEEALVKKTRDDSPGRPISENMTAKTKTLASASIFPFELGEGKTWSLLHMPEKIDIEFDPVKSTRPRRRFMYDMHGYESYTIIMADTSGSMDSFWENLLDPWNKYIAPKLIGRCDTYVFSRDVKLKRHSPELKQDDFLCSSTNLLGAIKTIKETIDRCREHNIKVFLLTDGHGDECPGNYIRYLEAPYGKTIEVFVLAFGTNFPVDYSVDIRAKLHTGSIDIPFIFWSAKEEDIENVFQLVSSHITQYRVECLSSHPGYHFPGSKPVEIFHPREWILLKESPDKLKTELKIVLDSNEVDGIEIQYFDTVSYDVVVKKVFSQWNALILQISRKGKPVDNIIFEVMEEFFKNETEKLREVNGPITCIKRRLFEKQLKTLKTDFQTLMNESKLLIDQTAKYKSEIDLAKLVIKTTCPGKYENKAIKLKGHTLEDFDEDSKKFIEIYNNIKSDIQKLPAPEPDDCCRITATSTLSDLQDEEFLNLFDTNKMVFLKEFTLTGIPIRRAISSAVDLNPWILKIENILINPFEILSQRALEFGMETKAPDEDGSIMLKDNDPSTKFNAVIPIFPEGTVETLKPLLMSKIFSMCCTFAILKNVLIIDYQCHVAALACAWLKTIQDFDKEKRPEFIIKRIKCIIETFGIYKNRKSLKTYAKCLVTNSNQALMTKSADKFEDVNIECNSLVKPAFVLFMYEDSLNPPESKKAEILELMLMEYIGRCITNLTSKTPYSQFFIQDFKSMKSKLYDDISSEVINTLLLEEQNQLDQYYTPLEIIKHLKNKLRSSLKDVVESEFKKLDVCTSIDVSKYKNASSCGNLTIETLKCWAKELNIKDFEKYFSSAKMRSYVIHAVSYKASKERMNTPLLPEDESVDFLFKKMVYENYKAIKKLTLSKLPKRVEAKWLECYYTAHHVIVSPMTKPEIIEAAVKQGVKVNEGTFDQVYKYRSNVGLVRNACMAAKCPHYLKPRRDFNEHVSVERKFNGFPHKLHVITSNNYKSDSEFLMTEIEKNKKTTNSKYTIDISMINDDLPNLKSEYSKFNEE